MSRDDLHGIDPTLAKLARQLRKDGWTVVRTSKGHIRWTAPGGATASTLAKPHGRTLRNGLQAIARAKAAPPLPKKSEK